MSKYVWEFIRRSWVPVTQLLPLPLASREKAAHGEPTFSSAFPCCQDRVEVMWFCF